MSRSLTTEPPAAEESRTRQHLRRVLVAMLFASAWSGLIGGAPWIRFIEQMGLKGHRYAWGLLSAIPFIGTFFQLVGSYWIERSGSRKTVFFAGFLTQRLTWLAVGILPLVILPGTAGAILGVLGLFLMYSLAGAVATPAWTSWMADVIPSRIRGRFFGFRHQVGLMVLIPVALLTGWLLDGSRAGMLRIPWPRGLTDWAWRTFPFHWSAVKLYGVLCIIGTVFGVIDILLFRRVPDRRGEAESRPTRLRDIFGPPLRNRQFVRFLTFYTAFQVAVPGIGYYVWLYVLNEVKTPEVWAQAMFMGGGGLGAILFAGMWGRLIDRFGQKTVWLVAYPVPVLLPLLYGMLRPGYWAFGFLVTFIDGIFWNGVEQTNFNSLLHFSSGDGNGRKGSSSYQAVFALALAVAGTLSGLLFGGLAKLVGSWRAEVGGMRLDYFHVVFAAATAIRVAAYVGLLPRLADDRYRGVWTVVQHMFETTSENIWAVLTFPWRVLGRLPSRSEEDDDGS